MPMNFSVSSKPLKLTRGTSTPDSGFGSHRRSDITCIRKDIEQRMTTSREQTAIRLARISRGQCICQEEADAPPCDCAGPVTREQIGRTHAYLSLHPDRAVIYSELAGEWLVALHVFLPESEDPLAAWLCEPFNVPPEADLHHASDLEVLLDLLGAPTIESLS
jgi:hypothetical protein